MGSPITLSGFNSIDFNVVLNAVMRQESRPLQALETRKDTLERTDTAYGTLTTKLNALKSATTGLASAPSVITNAATSSDTTAVVATARTGAAAGRHDVVVQSLAQAQVMVSENYVADANETIVASGGTITIGDVAVNIAGEVTLSGLAAQINAADGIGVTATVSETAPDQYRLILRSTETGEANAFTLTNALIGAALAFTDTDDDGISGESAADNAVQAANAQLQINGIPVESTTNTLANAIDGVTLDLKKADPDTTITVDVARDDADLTSRLNAFITAYNDLASFADAQMGTSSTIGRDTLLRSVRSELRTALSAAHGDGDFTRLAEIGLGFTREGQLTLDEDLLAEALDADPDAVTALFADGDDGAFDAIRTVINSYTQADGFIQSARTRLDEEVSRLDTRIADMEARLALRRQALQKQFVAADEAMTRLTSQSGTLSNLGGVLRASRL